MSRRLFRLGALLPLVLVSSCGFTGPLEFGPLMSPLPAPTHEEICKAQWTDWAALGLTPEQVPETPDQLLKARLAVGDTVELRATTTGLVGMCDDLVVSVAWQTNAADVASLESRGPVTARLTARSPGEAVVWAEVVLQGGVTKRVELHAKPAGRSTLLRVYGIVVTR